MGISKALEQRGGLASGLKALVRRSRDSAVVWSSRGSLSLLSAVLVTVLLVDFRQDRWASLSLPSQSYLT